MEYVHPEVGILPTVRGINKNNPAVQIENTRASS